MSESTIITNQPLDVIELLVQQAMSCTTKHAVVADLATGVDTEHIFGMGILKVGYDCENIISQHGKGQFTALLDEVKPYQRVIGVILPNQDQDVRLTIAPANIDIITEFFCVEIIQALSTETVGRCNDNPANNNQVQGGNRASRRRKKFKKHRRGL